MATFTITYNSKKSRAVVATAYNAHGVAILRNEDVFTHLKGLCGNMVYMSLLAMPQHLLENGTNYSIEQICYHTTHGLVAQSANEILTLLGSICTANKFEQATLHAVLSHCMLYEVCSDLKMPVRTIALFLTQAYYILTNDTVKLRKQEVLRNQQRLATFADYTLLFAED